MNTMRIYSSMYDGMSHADAVTNEIMERQKKIRNLRKTIARRYRQKAIYAQMIACYRRKIRIKTKHRDKLAKKLETYNKPFKKLLQQQREKIKLDMEKLRIHLQYLKKMSEVTKAAAKAYKKERRAYKRKFKASKVLHLTKNTALKKLKRRIRTTNEKYEDAIEVIDDLKKKLKLVKDRRKSLSLKDLKKKLQLNKERLEALQRSQNEQETLIYQVLPDSKVMGFQRKTTVVPVSNSQLNSYDIPKKSKSQTNRTRRVRKRMSGSFSTDTSMSRTSALKPATRQSESIVAQGDTVLEPIPIGDKLQDKPKRLAHRFTKRLADRTKKPKSSSSPPGDYKTPTTISADSDDTGVELKAKKKRVTLNIKDEPLPVSERKPLRFQKPTSSQEEISDEESQWLKMIFDDKYFDKLAGKYGPRIREELHEARLQKKLELERKLLEENEEKRKRAIEFPNRKELRASSIDSTKLNHAVKMAMKSTYKMTDVIPHNIQIIDEDILQLAGKHKRQTLQDVLKETEGKLERNPILEYVMSIKPVRPIHTTIRKSKLLKRRSSRKSQIKAEENDADERVTEEQVPKETISKKKVRKKKAPKKIVEAVSLTVSEDTTLGDPMLYESWHDILFSEDFIERRSRRSRGSSGKKIEGLAYNNNSMYHKFIEQKKNKSSEQEHGSITSLESIGKRTSERGSKQKTRESLEFQKHVQEIPKQQQEIQPTPVEAPKKRKSRTRAKRKSRVSLKTGTSTSQRESIGVIAPHQKDGSIRTVKKKSKVIFKPALHRLSHSTPEIPVQVDPRKEELPPTVAVHSPEVDKSNVEYDENYFQRLYKAHSIVIKKKLHQERIKRVELQKKSLAQEEHERDSLEKPSKSLASERESSFDSVAIMQKATASTYRMPDVIPHDIPVVDEEILELAGKTKRQTIKDVLEENFERTYSQEYPSTVSPVHKSSRRFHKKSKLFKKKRSKTSITKQRTDSDVSEEIINVINLQADSISQPDDSSKIDDTEESEAARLSAKKVEGLAYDHNSMYNNHIDGKKRKSLEENRASLAIEETSQSTKPRSSTKRETIPHKRRSRRSIKRRPKKFIVIKTSPIHLKDISQRKSEIQKPAQLALQELYQKQSYPSVKSEVRKTHSEPNIEKPNRDGEKSKSLPDVCCRTPEVEVVCSACGMTNLTPGGPCCPLIPKTK